MTILLVGCASSPPQDSGPTPQQVVRSGEARGQVHWGGRIVAVTNERERTLIEVLAFPLDSDGRPRQDTEPQGRFLAVQAGFLEPHEYPVGRLLGAQGMLDGFLRGRVGEASYRYPVVRAEQLMLWPVEAPTYGARRPRINVGVGGGSHGGSVGIGIGF